MAKGRKKKCPTYKKKSTAKNAARRKRKMGYNASVSKRKKGYAVCATRK